MTQVLLQNGGIARNDYLTTMSSDDFDFMMSLLIDTRNRIDSFIKAMSASQGKEKVTEDKGEK